MQFTLSSISTNKNAATTFTNYFTKESSVFLLFLFSFLICHLIVTVSAISALDLLSLSFLTYANGFVFSRTPICKTSRNDGCREYLTGVLTLRNEEVTNSLMKECRNHRDFSEFPNFWNCQRR